MKTEKSHQKGAGLNILSESDKLLVVDKPAGMSMDEIAGLPAHRLDKDTSGVLLVAKDEQTLKSLRQEFKERKVEKRYICLVEGGPKEKRGIIHTLLGRSPADRRKQRAYPIDEQKEGRRPLDKARGLREAITEWKALQRFNDYTLLEVTPKTGRKHQIRAHMASMGHPVAGDKLYGFKNQQIPEGLERQFLHASFLKIKEGEFTSPLPEDLQKVLKNLSPQNDNAD